jgi:Tol biopolymer transport system component
VTVTLASRSAVLLLFAAAPLAAANFRLSQGQSFSFASVVKISPDGRWTVYTQDAETQGAYELWRVPVQGGTPSRLSGLLTSGQSAGQFVISPNNALVAYMAAEDDLDHIEVYAAPIAAPPNSNVKLNDPFAALANAVTVEFSPDSSRVVFSVNYAEFEPIRELWSATPDGADLDLLVSVPDGREVRQWRITPDSQYLIYIARAADTTMELRRVSLAGGGDVELATDVPTGRTVFELAISPNGSFVVYTANRDVVDRYELFRVPVAGGMPQQISDELAFQHWIRSPTFAPDGSRVVYQLWDQAIGQVELWSMEPDGDPNVELNGLLVAGGSVDFGPTAFRISPDSTRVVYRADQQIQGDLELYSVPIAGGSDVKLNGPLVEDGDVGDFQISGDGTRVIYGADQEVDARYDLYSSAITGGPGMRISQVSLFDDTGVWTFGIAPDSSRVFYTLVREPLVGATSSHLYAVPIAGGTIQLIDDTDAGAGEDVYELEIDLSPVDSRVVVYIADQEAPQQQEVYYGDVCLLCNGFEGSWRWSSAPPP